MICPNCGIENVNISMEQTGTKTKKVCLFQACGNSWEIK